MKRILALILIFIVLLSIAACGGNRQTVQEQPGVSGQTKPQQTAPEQASEPEKTGDDVQGIVCVSYESYSNAWDTFSDHIAEQGGDHEIVSVHQSTVMPLELKNLTYLLPLSFLGQSQTSSGKFDAAVEIIMLKTGWADDAVLTYDEKTGYLLKGTDTQGNKLEIKVMFDDKADSLRLEGYKDGTLDFLFEYSRMSEGYAAQYYYETVTHMDKATPIYGWCSYKLIVAGSNGSCARFDNVTSEPDSIYGKIPDTQVFIDGATHWFTITEGKFAGTLGGNQF